MALHGGVDVAAGLSLLQQSGVEPAAIVLAHSTVAGWLYHWQTGEAWFSAASHALLGLAPDVKISAWCCLEQQLHPADRQVLAAAIQQHLAGHRPSFSCQIRLRQCRGSWLYCWCQGQSVPALPGGQWLSGTLVACQADEQRLQLLSALFLQTQQGVMITDTKPQIVDVNPAFSAITGYRREQVLGQNPSVLSSGLNDAGFYRQLWQQLLETGHWRGEIWNRRHDGAAYAQLLTIDAARNTDGVVSHYIAVFSDISLLLERQAQLASQVNTDPLTGLPNRRLLQDRLQVALLRAKRAQQAMAVCFIDLDQFKQLNDQYGHLAGDQVLIALADALQAELRPQDTVARLGGDEFVVLFTELTSLADLTALTQRLVRRIETHPANQHSGARITASMGVACYPNDADNAQLLLALADKAMYRAKQLGRNRICFHQLPVA